LTDPRDVPDETGSIVTTVGGDMSEENEPRSEKPEQKGSSSLEDLKDRLLEWIDALLHPAVLVPVPVRQRPSR
jgi:hypothetical protein